VPSNERSRRGTIAIVLYTGACLLAGAFLGAWLASSSYGSLPERLVADVGQIQTLMATPQGIASQEELQQRVERDFARRFVEAAVVMKDGNAVDRDRFARIAHWSLEQDIFSGQNVTSRRASKVATCLQERELKIIRSCIQDALNIQ